MEPLKEMFNKKFYEHLAVEFNRADKKFNASKFLKEVTQNIEHLSLNQRLRNTSIHLKNYLSTDFKKATQTLFKVIPNAKSGYTALVFPDFIGLYGHDDFDTSMEALKHFTSFGSSEFAIREFLKRDFNKTINVMNKWAKDKNHHVRRLASEGSRPRLPWSFKLGEVIKNPKATQSILETLKADEELYVKKSVANHLNDISKENANYMLTLVNSWDKSNIHTAWVVKHACRTLIKKGNAASMAVFSFEKNAKIQIKNLKLNKTKIRLGESLQFDFDLVSDKNKAQKLVIDYKIHYKKNSNVSSAKVFKLKELQLHPKQTIHISKSQVFKDFTTRKHYSGKHKVEIFVNGKTYGFKDFELVV